MMPPILANDPDGSLQKYVTSMLHIADINASGYTVPEEDSHNRGAEPDAADYRWESRNVEKV